MRLIEWFFRDQGWIAVVAIPLGIIGILLAIARLFALAYEAGVHAG